MYIDRQTDRRLNKHTNIHISVGQWDISQIVENQGVHKRLGDIERYGVL